MKTENNIDLSKIYDELSRLAEAAGTNLAQICRDANVNRSVLERWKKENPKTLDTVSALLKAIEDRKGKKIIVPVGGSEKVKR